ncbi:MAG: Hpt domain-containing protein [Nitrospinae bacterium]|nr:Hpt domain-containing protein [Nitrospinota bacterium]MZH15067.1 Hpt domain-containing protein [Nitrospinota bacterium]
MRLTAETVWKISVKKIIAHVDPDLRELIPGYLKNRRKDIKAIDAALKDSDLKKICTLGHSMKGSGGGYGFMEISVIGAAIELAAKEKAPDKILNHLDELKSYLKNVSVVYDSPT